jgi:hypothetical protein
VIRSLSLIHCYLRNVSVRCEQKGQCHMRAEGSVSHASQRGVHGYSYLPCTEIFFPLSKPLQVLGNVIQYIEDLL